MPLVTRSCEFGTVAWGILEPDSGVLLARRAVQAVVERALENGVTYLNAAVLPLEETKHEKAKGRKPSAGIDDSERIKVDSVGTVSGSKIFADQFVFACGPWLPKLFPVLLADLIHVTRQEVFFFGVPAGDDRFGPERMPAWIDFNNLIYGIPDLDQRGFKIAIDAHGPPFDPDTGERIVSSEGLLLHASFFASEFPSWRMLRLLKRVSANMKTLQTAIS